MVPGLGSVIGYPRPIPRRQWYVGVLVHHKCLDTMLRLTRFSVGVMDVSWSASPHGGRRTFGVLEGAAAHGVRVVFTSISHLQTDQHLCVYVLYFMFWGDENP